jgi:hypothetical protein
MNLDDDAALTAFQIRRRGGGEKLYAYASLREAGSTAPRLFGADDVSFEPVERWTSPRTRGVWPVAQRIRVGPRTFETRPLFADQELDSRASTSAVYWEGASLLTEGGGRVGRGYLEMTSYVEPIRLEAAAPGERPVPTPMRSLLATEAVWKLFRADRVTAPVRPTGVDRWGDTSKARIERRAFSSPSDWMTGSTRTARFASSMCLSMNSI